jgi:hypothetical protein
MLNLPITEHQQGQKPWPSSYRYMGSNGAGAHIFQDETGKRELFARRKTAYAGWCLHRGAWFFEFCASE